MLVYWLFKELSEGWDIETISMEDFFASIIAIIGIIICAIMDIVFIIPELLYIGFKLFVRYVNRGRRKK